MDKFQKLKAIILSEFINEIDLAKSDTCKSDDVIDIIVTASIKRGGICGKSVCIKKTNTNMKKILDEQGNI